MDLRTWITTDHAGLAARFEQAIAAHVPVDRWKERPGGVGASIAHLRFHATWHADLAVHGVVNDQPTVRDRWAARLGIAGFPAVAGLGEAEDEALTAALDPLALVGYAGEVGATVGAWLAMVPLEALDAVPPASDRLRARGVGEDAVPWLHQLWTDRPAWWFAQWEAIGHAQGHLGEMVSVRGRLGLSPF